MKPEEKQHASGFIRTISGDISLLDVGYTLCHEHGFLALNKESLPEINGYMGKIEKRMARDFKNLVSKGVNLFVEATPIGYCRPVEMWQRIGTKTGMNVVASTGCYVGSYIKPAERRKTVDVLARFFVNELTLGIDGTKCPAGVIKVASDGYELENYEKNVFSAAALVHLKTGAPITTHSPLAALAHLDKLAELGIPAEVVALGHIEVNSWVDILKVAKKGAMLLFTNFGGENIIPEDMIIAQIRDMIRRGYLSQVLISVDMYLYFKSGRLLYRNPGGYEQLVTRVLEKMTKIGIKPKWIDKILRENPLKHLRWNQN